MDMTRKQAIEILQNERDEDVFISEYRKQVHEALDMAIASLKTDEAYQLEYEGVQNIVITEGMTNGDVLCHMFPNMHYTLSEKTSRVVTTIGLASSFDIDWWNSPYKKEQTDVVQIGVVHDGN